VIRASLASHLTEEEKMAAPPCPQRQSLTVISGFITPESDLPPPHGLDASITMTVVDPRENDEVIRIAESADPFAVVVEWCICGPIVPGLAGCWNVKLFIDDIDGVGPTHGQLGPTRHVQVDSAPLVKVPPESSKRCYKLRLEFPGHTVRDGVYNLVATITLSTGSCANRGPLLGDTLGFAEIPVFVFFTD
jgi:hypothetical protein